MVSSLNKSTSLSIFSIFVEVLIGFSTFAIFFGIFMIYYFTEHEVSLLGNFLKTNVSYYLMNDTTINEKLQIGEIIKNSSKVKSIADNISKNEEEVNKHNAPYDRKLIYITAVMILTLLALLIIPVMLGIIKINQINFKYISVSILLHVILIVGFEILFLIVIVSYINPVKLYIAFQNNKAKTGSYF